MKLLGAFLLMAAGAANSSATIHRNSSDRRNGNDTFHLVGLTSPATVSNLIFLCLEKAPPGARVTFYIDGKVIDTQSQPPYWLGGARDRKPTGFRVEAVGYGDHTVRAVITDPAQRVHHSDVIAIHVIRSNNESFSRGLSPYVGNLPYLSGHPHISDESFPPTSSLSLTDQVVRRAVEAMYQNWGIDIFFDSRADRSARLRSLVPRDWAHPEAKDHNDLWSMRFSPDSVFYHAIPAEWPRVALPTGYFHTIQLNTAHGGDGIGFGVVVSDEESSTRLVRSQWYDVQSTLEEIPFRIPSGWSKELPTNPAGDRHLIFIDPRSMSFVSTYKTSVDSSTGAPKALYAARPTRFDSMGDSGGSIAANFSELPLLIQPGESTNRDQPIAHAIGGPVRRVWAARVYPASAWDAGVTTAIDTCSGKGKMNSGLVPYGGVIQLDPHLDLARLNLSLPAYRILQAMQTYGYYVMDYGCSDLDIYTALDASEFEPYGGLWGSSSGIGVQNEVGRVLSTANLYVVAPLIKK
jgi:hypothetical protein